MKNFFYYIILSVVILLSCQQNYTPNQKTNNNSKNNKYSINFHEAEEDYISLDGIKSYDKNNKLYSGILKERKQYFNKILKY